MSVMAVLAEDTAAIKEKITAEPNKVFFPNFGNTDNILREGIAIDRAVIKIPGIDFTIYWYGLLIGIGVLLAMIYGFKKMRSVGIDPDRATDAIIGGIIGALVGLRLYYVLFNNEGVTFKDFFNIRDGGLGIYGGLIGAIAVGGTIVKLKKFRLSAMLDVTAPGFLIGQCIGRWGNFFNQECFGVNTDKPWGMISHTTANFVAAHADKLADMDPYKPVHPCFLYESLWCLIGFLIVHLYFKHRKFDGEIFLIYTFWYGLGRFFIEGLRTDSLYIGQIRVSQLVAAVCVGVSLVLIIVFRGMVKRSGSYKFFYETEVSKAQLEEYAAYDDMEKEKKALKKKISEAKHKGESFAELEKEYKEKFGKDAVKARKEAIKAAVLKDKETADKPDDDYKSIVEEDEYKKEK